MLWLPWPAESRQSVTPGTNAATHSVTTLEAEQVRQVIRSVLESIDARRWESLTDDFSESVYVDYTSLFGGYARTYTADDLVDNWRQLLEPFSMTRHVVGPIVVEGDERRVQANCPVRISHFLRGAPGGEEWVVIGQFAFTLEKRDERWRIQRLALDVESQKGNTSLLMQAFGSPNKPLRCDECVVHKRGHQGQPPSTRANDLNLRIQPRGQFRLLKTGQPPEPSGSLASHSSWRLPWLMAQPPADRPWLTRRLGLNTPRDVRVADLSLADSIFDDSLREALRW
jgi:hypothetical protein